MIFDHSLTIVLLQFLFCFSFKAEFIRLIGNRCYLNDVFFHS